MLEVERKFTVDGSFVVPELAVNGWSAVSGGSVELDATYYDTEDLRLARAHITLRRRTGGKDAGWHLKLPAGAEREEIQRPLGRGNSVPRDLADLVLARTRGLALAPVARILTTRTLTTVTGADGIPLVEVADDAVTGERLGDTLQVSHWREIEAELLQPGQTKALDAVSRHLRRAGAARSASASKLAQTLGRTAATDAPPTTASVTGTEPTPDDAKATGSKSTGNKSTGRQATPTAGDAVTAYLREQVEALVAADPRVRREIDDAVHAMRVASRRLRTALATFTALLDPVGLGEVSAELKWLAGVLGEARDREVLQARMRGRLDELPDSLVLGPVRARLLEEELGGGRLRAHTDVLQALRGPRYRALLDCLDALAAAPPLTDAAGQPARAVLPRLARKTWKRLDRHALHALSTGVDADFHEARKAAKRARYTFEALTNPLGRRAAKLATTARAAQTVLGEHQDSVIARALLHHLAVNETQAFTYGLLYACELRRGTTSVASFTRSWAPARKTARRHLSRLGG